MAEKIKSADPRVEVAYAALSAAMARAMDIDGRTLSIREMVEVVLGSAAGWRPIETAPRDGTDFLAYIGYGYITRARFMRGLGFATDSMGAPRKGDDTTPTHWMPLPKGPTE